MILGPSLAPRLTHVAPLELQLVDLSSAFAMLATEPSPSPVYESKGHVFDLANFDSPFPSLHCM
jgi:hypothetical protein